MRLNNSWQPPKPTAIRYTQETPVDREATKLEKLKTVLAGPNTNLGKSYILHRLFLDHFLFLDNIEKIQEQLK